MQEGFSFWPVQKRHADIMTCLDFRWSWRSAHIRPWKAKLTRMSLEVSSVLHRRLRALWLLLRYPLQLSCSGYIISATASKQLKVVRPRVSSVSEQLHCIKRDGCAHTNIRHPCKQMQMSCKIPWPYGCPEWPDKILQKSHIMPAHLICMPQCDSMPARSWRRLQSGTVTMLVIAFPSLHASNEYSKIF